MQRYALLDESPVPQITWAVLAALLLHALVLAIFQLSKTETATPQKQTIDVTLEAPTPNAPPVQEKPSVRPAPQPKPETPPPPTPQPQVDETAKTVVEPSPQPPQPAANTIAPASPAPAPAPAEEIQPLFRLTRMPGFSRKVEAIYPPDARRAGAQANVLAEVTIDSQGNVLAVRILKSGGSAFDEAVKQALQKSSFSPGMIDGKPVGTRFQVPFRFNLN